ncbi:chaperone modulator CbpM [Halocola ammonii]
MKNQRYITLKTICESHDITESFVISLSEFELIEVVEDNREKKIAESQLTDLEKFIRISNDLDVNVAGIEVIHRLTKKMERMQREMELLEKRLEIYEP